MKRNLKTLGSAVVATCLSLVSLGSLAADLGIGLFLDKDRAC
jgi:hypothetical protein